MLKKREDLEQRKLKQKKRTNRSLHYQLDTALTDPSILRSKSIIMIKV
eukprot:SAG11_NODE_5647_length_1496_cov_2.614173_1_plen_48_part_00